MVIEVGGVKFSLNSKHVLKFNDGESKTEIDFGLPTPEELKNKKGTRRLTERFVILAYDGLNYSLNSKLILKIKDKNGLLGMNFTRPNKTELGAKSGTRPILKEISYLNQTITDQSYYVYTSQMINSN
ncbi:unnamed protein product [Schistosoma spindalis]|nr:unnamed protein product [Schistosoma spindale]